MKTGPLVASDFFRERRRESSIFAPARTFAQANRRIYAA